MVDPTCFVLIPTGRKSDPSGHVTDFDQVFESLISPAIAHAGMRPLRAEEEAFGGVMHGSLLERLILCDCAIADLSSGDASVFYALGARQALRPATTVALLQGHTALPFDTAAIQAIPYTTDAVGAPENEADARRSLTAALVAASRSGPCDLPMLQLLKGLKSNDVGHAWADGWDERMQYAESAKEKLRDGRQQGLAKLQEVQRELGDLSTLESGVLIDLMLSYRSIGSTEAFQQMADLPDLFPDPIRQSPLIQSQRALALNRVGQDDAAEEILLKLIERHGPSSETNALLGRVYKDRWRRAQEDGFEEQAIGWLEKAIDAYVAGIEADWRDAYPGINALMLMQHLKTEDERRASLLPIVRFAAQRSQASHAATYYDHATLLELAILADDRQSAEKHLRKALSCAVENTEFSRLSTAQTLRDISSAGHGARRDRSWVQDIIHELERDRS